MTRPVIYRLRNNPTKRGFYAAAYRSDPATDEQQAIGITANLILLEKIESGTRKGADNAWDILKAKYGKEI